MMRYSLIPLLLFCLLTGLKEAHFSLFDTFKENFSDLYTSVQKKQLNKKVVVIGIDEKI
ncbi:MAG: hypothetical protein FAF04_08620 [Epsilonproteobacteria bacterium]|nr:hypothetical protein [Campylobacterota bacterium]